MCLSSLSVSSLIAGLCLSYFIFLSPAPGLALVGALCSFVEGGREVERGKRGRKNRRRTRSKKKRERNELFFKEK